MYCDCNTWTNRKGQKHDRLFYSCKIKREIRDCKQSRVNCSIIDEQVINYMSGLELPEDIIQKTLDKLERMFDKATKSPVDRNKIKQLESKKRD